MQNVEPREGSEETSARATKGVSFTQIPDHELIRKIGGGSYGEVWLARSALGTYRAVKIVYRKHFSHDRPFEREFSGIQKYEPVSRAQPGLMDILQVGRNNEAGYFYYVMELADDVSSGHQIDPANYAPHTLSHELHKRGRLPFEECLNIGLTLTSALGHLHKHGLVHRDIKPSNIIFVNGAAELADIGLVTDLEEAKSYVGTEGFIPPEGPGTVRADLYSLGKVLYEMSTGKDRFDYPALPNNLDDTNSPQELIELNEIVLKACRADPRERYQSADQMHADLWLLHRGRSLKQVRKLQRRLAVATRVGIVAMAAALLAAGAWLGSIKQIRRALAAEKTAKAEAAKEEALVGFLLDDLLLEASTDRNAVKSNITLRAVLDKAAAKLDARFTNQVELAAATHHTLGEVYLSLDLEPEADAHFQKAMELRKQHLGPEHPDTLETQDRIATVRQSQGNLVEAERLFRKTLEARQRLLGPKDDATLASIQNLGSLLSDAVRPAEAEPFFRTNIALFERVYGTNTAPALHFRMGLPLALQRLGRLDEALAEAQLVYAAAQKAFRRDDPRFLSMANVYATILQNKGRLAEAEKIFREVMDTRVIVQGDEHWHTLIAINNVAVCLHKEGKSEEALAFYKRSADGFRRLFGPNDYRCLHIVNNMGLVLLDLGRTREAEEIFREVLPLRRIVLGTNALPVSDTLIGMGQALTQNGKAAEAEPLLHEAIEICQKAKPVPARRLAEAQSALGGCLTALGRYAGAEPLVLAGDKALVAAEGVSSNLLHTARSRVVILYESWGKNEEADRWRDPAPNR
jgi:tetratricopeptide (TPR) repeat protein